MIDWNPIILTLELALITTLLLFVVALPLSYWLAYTKLAIKPILETLISMPLVLPPTVLGFYILITFNPEGWLGKYLLQIFGLELLFSFEGLVVASMIYSLPFMVHPLQSGFQNLPDSLWEASYTLGKSPWTTLFRVLLPNIRPQILTGLVLSFAHTIGEFGVVLMIGGSIPGSTRVASIAIYDEVEALNYDLAHTYSLILFIISFCILLSVYLLNGGYLKTFYRE